MHARIAAHVLHLAVYCLGSSPDNSQPLDFVQLLGYLQPSAKQMCSVFATFAVCISPLIFILRVGSGAPAPFHDSPLVLIHIYSLSESIHLCMNIHVFLFLSIYCSCNFKKPILSIVFVYSCSIIFQLFVLKKHG